jgi:hypothetical protein
LILNDITTLRCSPIRTAWSRIRMKGSALSATARASAAIVTPHVSSLSRQSKTRPKTSGEFSTVETILRDTGLMDVWTPLPAFVAMEIPNQPKPANRVMGSIRKHNRGEGA